MPGQLGLDPGLPHRAQFTQLAFKSIVFPLGIIC
jgi:hypothetical protein